MGETNYQARVSSWVKTITDSESIDSAERTHRFLEEALELAQASGCSRDDAVALIDYVFSRPVGEPQLEAGAVLVTLAGLCSSLNIDMQSAGETELRRNWERVEAIKLKRSSKPKDSPLPQ